MAQSPFEELMKNIAGQVGPGLSSGLAPVVQRFLDQFQLVPKQQFSRELETIEAMETTITQLEQRVTQLEQDAAKARKKATAKPKAKAKKKSKAKDGKGSTTARKSSKKT